MVWIETNYKIDIETKGVVKWDGFWHPNNYGYEIGKK
jgi:hypothetical protein